jgi:hypothetical protein
MALNFEAVFGAKWRDDAREEGITDEMLEQFEALAA